MIRALQAEAARSKVTAYALAQKTGLRIHTMQRLLAGVGSPTLTTIEAAAKALGMTVRVERER